MMNFDSVKRNFDDGRSDLLASFTFLFQLISILLFFRSHKLLLFEHKYKKVMLVLCDVYRF